MRHDISARHDLFPVCPSSLAGHDLAQFLDSHKDLSSQVPHHWNLPDQALDPEILFRPKTMHPDKTRNT